MNRRRVLKILGKILMTEAMLMVPSLIVSLIYGDGDAMYFIGTIAFAAIAGFILSCVKAPERKMGSRDGYCIVALAWIIICIIGAVPLFLTGQFRSYWSALFEIVSGFTTTGASVLSNPEYLPHGVLFWRSFTHWVGGMGVLVFVLMIMPMENENSMHLIRAEVPGPVAGKLVPRMKKTSIILYGIYTAMTAILVVLLLFGGMNVFDAFATAFGTAGTGGFATSSAGIAGYDSAYIEIVLGIFMLLFGVNFNAYYLILFKKIKKAFSLEEVRWYFIIIISAIAFLFVNILETSANALRALTDASFQVASIITTTGFSTTDFDQWSGACKTVLVLLMFIGACAGSTGGGIKVSRILIMFKSVVKEVHSYLHPNSVKKIKIEDKPVEHEVLRSTNVYLITYICIFVVSCFIVSFDEYDLITNFTAVAATINNIGPGLELVGPIRNFSFFSPVSKFVLMFDMLAGRLELFPLLLFFHPGIWKELLVSSHKKKVRQRELAKKLKSKVCK